VSTSLRPNLLLYGAAVLVFALDQLTKAWIRSILVPNQSLPEDAPVRLTYVTNTGGAFGLLQDQTLFFTLVAVLVIGAIFFYARRLPSAGGWRVLLALGMQLGGALGNLLDRVRLGHVVDFIDFRFWPVFNIADSAIVVGVIILAYTYLFDPGRRTESTPG
jgi:signal peptidase II